MNKILILLLNFVFLISPVLSQNQIHSVNKMDELNLVYAAKSIQQEVNCQYAVEETSLNILSAQKMDPVGRGVVIGFFAGASAGFLTGYLTRKGNSERPEKQQTVYVSTMTALGSMLGIGVGSMIGFSSQYNSSNGDSYNPLPGEVPFLIVSKKF